METNEPESDYRVEVSGWDALECFFVEKATLELGQKGDRYVHLRHPVRAGLIVYLRLIESQANIPTFPVAYQVKEVSAAGSGGVSRVSLLRLPRRHGNQGGAAGPAGSAGAP